jgi:hypothetical protein
MTQRKGQPYHSLHREYNDDGSTRATIRGTKINGKFAVAVDDHHEVAWFRYTNDLKTTLRYFKRLKDIVARGNDLPVNPLPMV